MLNNFNRGNQPFKKKIKECKMKRFKVLMVMVIVAVLGFGSHAFAGKGNRPGKGEGFKNCPAVKNLSPEDLQKVKAEKQAFHKDADVIKQQIQQKRLDLRTEMRKSSTDAQKASALQKEISDLEAQIGQKRIQYLLNLKKINPALSECIEAGGGKGAKKGQRTEKQNSDK